MSFNGVGAIDKLGNSLELVKNCMKFWEIWLKMFDTVNIEDLILEKKSKLLFN